MSGRRAGLALAILAALVAGGCASSPSARVPWPAFVQADELEGTFTAALPGTRARVLFGDRRRGITTLLLELPPEWDWNAGGGPGKSVEIYVLEGEITLGDLALLAGNYAYLPPGATAMPMRSASGARLLYVLDEADPQAVIRTPLFMSRDVVPWQPVAGESAGAGPARKMLRRDSGSGAATYLLRIPAGPHPGWQVSAAQTEGFLLSGGDRLAECVAGTAVAGRYTSGGYFRRPAGTVSGGPEAGSESGAVWLIRQAGAAHPKPAATCRIP